MEKDKFTHLLSVHTARELPPNYTLLSPAAEVAALLKDHAREKQAWVNTSAQEGHKQDQLLGALTALVFQLEEAVNRARTPMVERELKREHQELRLIKDQIVDLLKGAGFTWRNPQGERFEGDLPDQVSVDGWRHGPQFAETVIAQVREPIIHKGDQVVREGKVTVGAPAPTESDSEAAQEASKG
ncbi:MAG: hypothetical protein IAE83_03325 [Anaerolinea sp.]|nr:hypothetical protein [Anaerolinea sp.]